MTAQTWEDAVRRAEPTVVTLEPADVVAIHEAGAGREAAALIAELRTAMASLCPVAEARDLAQRRGA